MTISVKRTALIATSVAFGMSAVVAPIAMAVSSPASRMLSKADVPAIFGTPKNYEFTNKITKLDKVIPLCFGTGGKALYSQPASKVQYAADSETKNGKTYTDVSERVYQYGSVGEAAAAFDSLSTGVAACTGTFTDANQDTKYVDTYQNGTFTGTSYKNFWVEDNGSGGVVGDKTRQGNTTTFNVYSLSGNAVIKTFVYINGQDKFPPAEISAMQDLSMKLSKKWAK